jgi:uncharacterized membrane protein
MIDIILAIKFVHVLFAAVMVGTWLGAAAFMVFAHRSGNPSVIALVSQFAVRLELFFVAPAIVVQPISGFPLGNVIGLSPADDFWIDGSIVIYAIVVVAWLAALRMEFRIRSLARDAALAGTRLTDAYPRLFRIWLALACLIFAGMIALILVMIWQPRLD